MSNLISGKEALIALANGELVLIRSVDWENFDDLTLDFSLHVFHSNDYEFRLKPKTIMLNGVDGKSFGKRLTIEDLEDMVKKENSTSNRMEYFEKYLKGVDIQYKLDDKEDSQWHNMTSNALQYFQRSDIRLRDKPKTLFINTIEFKTIDSLVKYVKNNYDLDG